MEKSADAFRTISEAAEQLDLPQHVLRFWETRFTQIKPMKRAGGRRYYRPEDVELLSGIRHLLYAEGYTIKGVQRILKQPQGVRTVVDLVQQLRTERPRGGAVAAMVAMDADAATAGAMAAESDQAQQRGQPAIPAAAAQWEQGSAMAQRAAVDAQLRWMLAEISECQRLLSAARQVDAG